MRVAENTWFLNYKHHWEKDVSIIHGNVPVTISKTITAEKQDSDMVLYRIGRTENTHNLGRI